MIQSILLQIQELAERDIIKTVGNQNIIKNGIKIKNSLLRIDKDISTSMFFVLNTAIGILLISL